MTTLTDTAESQPTARPPRGRGRAVAVLVVLTTLATFVSTIAVWAHAVLLNTDRWVATVGPLAEDEDVTDAVAAYLVDQVFLVLNVQTLAEEALPDRADFLAAPLTDAVQGFVTTKTEELLQTDQFHTFWVEANRFAHSQAVRLLRGESGVVAIREGEVTLSLLPMIAVILQKLDDFDLLPDGVTVPDIDRTTPPDEAVAALSDALGRDLPDDFGQIVVFDSDTLAQAQDAVEIFDRLVVGIVVLTVVLAIASIALSPRRRRTILQLGFSVVGALVLSAALVNAATGHVLGLIDDDLDRSAAAAVVSRIIRSLRNVERWIALIALVAAVAAFVTGDSTWAHKVRGAFSQARRRGRPAEGEPTPVAVSWADRHRDALRLLGIVAALLLLLLLDLTFVGLLVLALALVAYEVLIALIPREPAAEEQPPAPGAVA